MSRRSFRAAAIATLACLPAVAVAQSKFEGAITARLGSAAEVTYMLKGNQLRMDMAGRGGMSVYLIHDGTTNSSMMVMPAQRIYMDAGAMAAMTGQASAAAQKTKAPKFQLTGKKETIAGYECEHMTVTGDDGAQFDVCGAKGLGTFAQMSNPMGGRSGGASDSWQRGMSDDFFPLRVQKVGGETVLEVTKIEKKSLDPSLFSVPSDFTKMDMSGMGRRPPQ